MTQPEREITTPVSLCLPSGRLNPDAVGWTRHPLHDTSGIGRGLFGAGRTKRWEYWGVVTPNHVIALTISALDYATLSSLWLLDRATGEEIERTVIGPLSCGVDLPATLAAGPARATARHLGIAVDEIDGGTRLRARTDRVWLDVVAHRPDGHESLGVVVPWSDRLFQYTVKDVARPAQGRLRVDGRGYPVPEDGSWAVLDHGRGRWPYSLSWNWGAGSGTTNGERIGIQIGGQWTRGTGSTENALFWRDRVHKISEELTWEYDRNDWLAPWRITGERAELILTPFHDRVSTMNLGVIAHATHQCFGTFTGWMAADDGTSVPVDGAVGWVEDVHNRW